MSKKLFGFKGTITPTAVINDVSESWEQDGIEFSIKDCVFEVKYSTSNEKVEALRMANLYIEAWNFQQGTKLEIDFNHFWEPKNNGGSFHSLDLRDSVSLSDRATSHTITHTLTYSVKARIVGKSDSASLMANKQLVEKGLKDEALRKALKYYAEEIISDKRPLQGIYKALEVLVEKLRGNRKKKYGIQLLGQLANHDTKYVEDVLETTQPQRHAITQARALLTTQECSRRAKELIDAYANTI